MGINLDINELLKELDPKTRQIIIMVFMISCFLGLIYFLTKYDKKQKEQKNIAFDNREQKGTIINQPTNPINFEIKTSFDEQKSPQNFKNPFDYTEIIVNGQSYCLSPKPLNEQFEIPFFLPSNSCVRDSMNRIKK